MPIHPIFDDIRRGELEAAKQHVLANAAVLEEKNVLQMTPLIYAIYHSKPAIAHWLIDYRGQHDINTQDYHEWTALHYACTWGPLSIVQALVASGADSGVTERDLKTPLVFASMIRHPDIVAYLLQLPAVRATVNDVGLFIYTALSYASRKGSASSVQLLLDAGADPTIPDGNNSPLCNAIYHGHTAIAALLGAAIAEPDGARALHKARALLDAAIVINKARHDAHDGGHAPAVQRQHAIAAAPVYLQGRLQQRQGDEAPLPLPVPELVAQQRGWGDERVRATAAFVLGLEEGGVAYAGLPRELYEEVLGYMTHAWMDKGPEDDSGGDDDDGSGSESGSESEGSDTD